MGRGHIREAVTQAPPVLTCYQALQASSEKLGDNPKSHCLTGLRRDSPPLTSSLTLLKPPVKDTLLSSQAPSGPVRLEGDMLWGAEWIRPHKEGRGPGDLRGTGSCLSGQT